MDILVSGNEHIIKLIHELKIEEGDFISEEEWTVLLKRMQKENMNGKEQP